MMTWLRMSLSFMIFNSAVRSNGGCLPQSNSLFLFTDTLFSEMFSLLIYIGNSPKITAVLIGNSIRLASEVESGDALG